MTAAKVDNEWKNLRQEWPNLELAPEPTLPPEWLAMAADPNPPPPVNNLLIPSDGKKTSRTRDVRMECPTTHLKTNAGHAGWSCLMHPWSAMSASRSPHPSKRRMTPKNMSWFSI